MRKRHLGIALALAGLASGVVTAVPAQATVGHPELAKLVKVKDIRGHLAALEKIAKANGGNRASGQPGYDASVDYVVKVLKRAGYRPQVLPFEFDYYEQQAPTVFEQTAPDPATYAEDAEGDFLTLEYSAEGDVTAPAAPVDTDQPDGLGSGCEADDFAGFPAGSIALIQRGGCNFSVKVANAEDAGAVGAVIYQRPDVAGPVAGTLSGPVGIPVVGPTYELGIGLVGKAKAGGVSLRIKTDVFHERRSSKNVIADTRLGNPGKKVVVGAHLDSVVEGPGINDNGSGTATLLAMAQQIGKLGKKGLRNQVRFAWWGAEEGGLIGSNAYVAALSEAELSTIALNLNFDMLGSPNFARFVYDGDNSLGTPTVPPPGSAEIEKAFTDYFGKRGLATEPTAFDGRSDYFAFINAGIPAGGLFSGAEGVKTAEQVPLYGGTAGEAYDKCYHSACDGLSNINWTGLDQLADGAAHVTQRFARSVEEVTGAGSARTMTLKKASAADTADWRGGALIR
ncbi:PA domain-containing protein [Thermomonospora echinospora]|uniref:PA domain-containing protein n=1 Tax=Thermomonospora echinospora TaxID=1992 RepID=A0A1H5VWI1_9ACTN|nr:M28 family peptidase [Thermomonospora echinospora]SEF91604.1 PA domain-containing protein [Thermomonospora echinospora]